jgi:hypothetical protein
LRIQVNYLFVCAVQPLGVPADWMRLIAHPNTAPGQVQPSGPAINPYPLSTIGPAVSCGMTTGT